MYEDRQRDEGNAMSLESEATKGLLAWAKGQPFNNVLIVLQLTVIGFLGWYAITYVVPEERKAIIEYGTSLEAAQSKQVETITKTYERMLDRVSPGKEPERNGAVAGK